MPKPKHPLQTIGYAPDGIVRFTHNQLVNELLDKYPGGLNQLVKVLHPSEGYREDWEQLAQLIGYSVCGFNELSYVSYDRARYARKILGKLVKKKGGG